MKTKFKLVTWNIDEECIFSKEYKYENEAIEAAIALGNRKVHPHNVITILKTKKTGHRWDLDVWNIEKPQKMKHISFYSKIDAIFAIKGIKEYDDTLKVNLNKIY